MHSIKVKGKTYSFCWGTLAFMNACDKLGVTLNELDLAIWAGEQKAWWTLAYQALVVNDMTANNGANIVNGELDGFNFAQFVNWLDNASDKEGETISKSYMDSKYLGKTMQEHYDNMLAKLNIDIDEETKEKSVPAKKKNARLPK